LARIPREPLPTAVIYFFFDEIQRQVRSMAKTYSTGNMPILRIHGPLAVALAVAVFGVAAMLLVDHGPWNKPHLRTAMINYGTTAAAAQAAGARVTPTVRKPVLEPEARDRSPRNPRTTSRHRPRVAGFELLAA
jgi:hypothetical protein